MSGDDRLDLLTAWVRRIDGFEDVTPVPASEDASFRRYFRVQADQSYIVMDAPPAQEDSKPFVEIAGFLEQMGINGPRVLEGDLDQGFLLITDLGTVPYLQEIEQKPEIADRLYRDAIDALLAIIGEGAEFQSRLPPYDEKLLRFELSLFHDWLCEKHLGLEFSDDDEQAWRTCCDMLVANALSQRKVFVHRDYHSRNLMVTDARNPGVIDFQDAVEGPYTYDLVSLLKDCYVKWPADVIRSRAEYFYSRLPDAPDIHRFNLDFELMGVQRHLKAAGIFARLKHRDGKGGFMHDVPRTLSYIVELKSEYDELEPLIDLISERVLPGLGAPD